MNDHGDRRPSGEQDDPARAPRDRPTPTPTPAPPPSQREMLAAYFGLSAVPELRPDRVADLLWIVPAAVVLIGAALFAGRSPNIAAVVLILVTGLLAYAVSLRVRYVTRVDEQAGRRPPRRG